MEDGGSGGGTRLVTRVTILLHPPNLKCAHEVWTGAGTFQNSRGCNRGAVAEANAIGQ